MGSKWVNVLAHSLLRVFADMLQGESLVVFAA